MRGVGLSRAWTCDAGLARATLRMPERSKGLTSEMKIFVLEKIINKRVLIRETGKMREKRLEKQATFHPRSFFQMHLRHQLHLPVAVDTAVVAEATTAAITLMVKQL